MHDMYTIPVCIAEEISIIIFTLLVVFMYDSQGTKQFEELPSVHQHYVVKKVFVFFLLFFLFYF